MKNITVSLDVNLYRKARVAAAENDTSVTALVREFLTALTAESGRSAEDAKAARAVLATVRKMRRRHPGFDPSDRQSRNQIHAR